MTLSPSNTYLIDPDYGPALAAIVDTSTTVRVARYSDAVEPNPVGSIASQTGEFLVTREDGRVSPALTVTYQLSGLAQNGVDYTNLSGTVTIPVNQDSASVFIAPQADNQPEGDENVTLTLTTSGDGYLIDSNSPAATLTIVDNLATNTFVPVVTNLTSPIGIDYHAPSNSLIVSYNYSSSSGGGQPFNFARIYTSTVSSNVVTVVTNWSGVHGVLDEVKLATVKASVAGFTNGDLYFGSSNGIGWISADGTKSNLNWCILTNGVVTNALPIRGSLYVDQSGVFSNQLVAVTSPDTVASVDKGVWRVSAQGIPTLITNVSTFHLEGVITLTNDAAKWGPWAGKTLTGDEDANPEPLIYTIDLNGITNSFALGIHPEDFDIIPTNQDLYATDPNRNIVLKVSRNYLTNYIGDLLITDAGEVAPPGKLFIVHWDSATTNFIVRSIPYRLSNGSPGRFEHISFAPIDLPPK